MTATVDRDRSFGYFVYPFLFDPASGTPTSFDSLSSQIDAASILGKHVWEKVPFPTADLMPHVGGFLNPTAADSRTGRPLTARIWKLHDDDKVGLGNEFGLAGKAVWYLSFYGKREIPFRFGEVGEKKFAVQLVLFSIGVGFVVIQAAPHSDSLAEWLDFVHAFRFLRGRSEITIRAEKRKSREETVAFVPAGVLDSTSDHTFSFMDVIAGLLTTAASQGATWWRPVFVPDTCLPFTNISVRGASEEDRTAVIYRMRNFFHATQDIHPSSEDLKPDHPMSLAYTANQWFLFSLNGGAFASFDAPDTEFFKTTLPGHLRNIYFLAFLLVLHQRFALAMLSEQVVQHGLNGTEEEQLEAFKRIRDSLLLFTARGYFTQAMQSDHHHRYYRKWQEVLQIPQLYDEVRDEVRDMYERSTLCLRQRDDERERREEKRDKRLEERLSLLGLLFAVPALIVGFLGVNIRGYTSHEDGLSLAVVTSWFVGGFIVAALIYCLWTRFRDKDDL